MGTNNEKGVSMHEEQLTMNRLQELRGEPVYDSGGKKIGKVEGIYHDWQTGEPEWIALGAGFFGKKRLLVPVRGASADGDGVSVPYSKDKVQDSPEFDSDEIDEQTEARLASHYGLGYSERRSDTGLPEPRGETGAGEASVTRSEEELRVGKRDVEAGRVRLHKWVDTEPVEADVELTRERAHVSRERVDEPVAGHELGEEEVEVPLRAEEPVVQKEAVAKERIAVGKHAERERQTVTDELRKERVDVDDHGVENVDDID